MNHQFFNGSNSAIYNSGASPKVFTDILSVDDMTTFLWQIPAAVFVAGGVGGGASLPITDLRMSFRRVSLARNARVQTKDFIPYVWGSDGIDCTSAFTEQDSAANNEWTDENTADLIKLNSKTGDVETLSYSSDPDGPLRVGGYIFDIPLRPNSTELAEVQHDDGSAYTDPQYVQYRIEQALEWGIGGHDTACVTLELATLNAYEKLVTHIAILFSLNRYGVVSSDVEVMSMPIYSSSRKTDFAVSISFSAVLALYCILDIIYIIWRMISNYKLFPTDMKLSEKLLEIISPTRVMNILIDLLCLAVVGILYWAAIESTSLSVPLSDFGGDNATSDATTIDSTTPLDETEFMKTLESFKTTITLLRRVLACALLCVTFRLVNEISVVSDSLVTLTRTVTKALQIGFSLLLVSALLFVGFSIAATTGFGGSQSGLSTVSSSMGSLTIIIFGDIDIIEEMLESNSFLALVFYVVFTLLFFFVIVNVVLGILSQVFVDVRAEVRAAKKARRLLAADRAASRTASRIKKKKVINTNDDVNEFDNITNMNTIKPESSTDESDAGYRLRRSVRRGKAATRQLQKARIHFSPPILFDVLFWWLVTTMVWIHADIGFSWGLQNRISDTLNGTEFETPFISESLAFEFSLISDSTPNNPFSSDFGRRLADDDNSTTTLNGAVSLMDTTLDTVTSRDDVAAFIEQAISVIMFNDDKQTIVSTLFETVPEIFIQTNSSSSSSGRRRLTSATPTSAEDYPLMFDDWLVFVSPLPVRFRIIVAPPVIVDEGNDSEFPTGLLTVSERTLIPIFNSGVSDDSIDRDTFKSTITAYDKISDLLAFTSSSSGDAMCTLLTDDNAELMVDDWESLLKSNPAVFVIDCYMNRDSNDTVSLTALIKDVIKSQYILNFYVDFILLTLNDPAALVHTQMSLEIDTGGNAAFSPSIAVFVLDRYAEHGNLQIALEVFVFLFLLFTFGSLIYRLIVRPIIISKLCSPPCLCMFGSNSGSRQSRDEAVLSQAKSLGLTQNGGPGEASLTQKQRNVVNKWRVKPHSIQAAWAWLLKKSTPGGGVKLQDKAASDLASAAIAAGATADSESKDGALKEGAVTVEDGGVSIDNGKSEGANGIVIYDIKLWRFGDTHIDLAPMPPPVAGARAGIISTDPEMIARYTLLELRGEEARSSLRTLLKHIGMGGEEGESGVRSSISSIGPTTKLWASVHETWATMIDDWYVIIDILTVLILIVYFAIWYTLVSNSKSSLNSTSDDSSSSSDSAADYADHVGSLSSNIADLIPPSDGAEYSELIKQIGTLANLVRVTKALGISAVIFSSVRAFRMFRGSPRMSLMVLVLQRVWLSATALICLLALILLAFVLGGHAAFGHLQEDFSTIPGAWMICFEMVNGIFNLDDIRGADSLMAPFFFYPFLFVLYFFVINIFLALLDDAYHALCEDFGEKKNNRHEKIRRMARKRRQKLSTEDIMKQRQIASAKSFFDTMVDPDDRIFELIRTRIKKAKVEDAYNYDFNADDDVIIEQNNSKNENESEADAEEEEEQNKKNELALLEDPVERFLKEKENSDWLLAQEADEDDELFGSDLSDDETKRLELTFTGRITLGMRSLGLLQKRRVRKVSHDQLVNEESLKDFRIRRKNEKTITEVLLQKAKVQRKEAELQLLRAQQAGLISAHATLEDIMNVSASNAKFVFQTMTKRQYDNLSSQVRTFADMMVALVSRAQFARRTAEVRNASSNILGDPKELVYARRLLEAQAWVHQEQKKVVSQMSAVQEQLSSVSTYQLPRSLKAKEDSLNYVASLEARIAQNEVRNQILMRKFRTEDVEEEEEILEL